MENIKVSELTKHFTLPYEDMTEIAETLELDPYDILKAILTHTDDPEYIVKSTPITIALYFSEMGFRQGFLRALYDITETNKSIIKDLATR